MAYRYGQYREIYPGLNASIGEAEKLQKEFNIEGFLDTYSPGWDKELRNVWGWWKSYKMVS